MNRRRKKAVNFDLDTKKMKVVYPGKHYRKGYRDIKRFLEANGFKHRQWSGYISDKPLSEIEMAKVAQKINKTFPWLKKCVRRFDVTDIGEQFDMMYIFEESRRTPEKQMKHTADKKPEHSKEKQEHSEHTAESKPKPILSRAVIEKNAAIISQKQQEQQKSNLDKKKNQEQSL